MSNEEKKVPAPAPTKGIAVKKSDEKPSIPRRVRKWFRDMRSELKKVIWPTPEQTVKNTGVSLFVMALAAVVLFGFDKLAEAGVKAIITLVG